VCLCAQIHLTQGATPADMYISWATGNAVYTYCSQNDGAKCGDATNACECNQKAPTMTSSQVQPTLCTENEVFCTLHSLIYQNIGKSFSAWGTPYEQIFPYATGMAWLADPVIVSSQP